MTPEVLSQALAAAGFRPGECFELAVLVGPRDMRTAAFVEIEAACAFLAGMPEGGRYLCLNPILAGDAPAHGRASGKEGERIASVRCLLVDVDTGDPPDPKNRDAEDPDGTAPAKREAARAIAAELVEVLGARASAPPAWIDSGRGQQVWVQHEPLARGDARLTLRARLLRGLARRFNRPGLAHVDTGRSAIAQLARLPGTVNQKTGAVARLVEIEAW